MKTTATGQDRSSNATRSFPGCFIREAEDEAGGRTFTLSFSSEDPYVRWFGPEILSHADGCVDLDRLNSIGVLLFNHDRDEVLGRIDKAWIEDNRGYAQVTFDADADAETIFQKVRGGTLKGVSVGYAVDVWEDVAPGAVSEDGRFTGPCSIAKRWTPYEVSIVSVPADATVGVGRSLEVPGTDMLETYQRLYTYNSNLRHKEV